MLIDPSSFENLKELLDELYRKLLTAEYPPYTYGERWILADGNHYYCDQLCETRVLAPPIWAANDRQAIHRIAPSWQRHKLAHYGITPGSSWSLYDIDGNDKFYGLATNNPDLADYLLQSPKAIALIREQLRTIRSSDWHESTYQYNHVFGDWLSQGPGPGQILVDPGIDLAVI